jgi:hypothetical protein
MKMEKLILNKMFKVKNKNNKTGFVIVLFIFLFTTSIFPMSLYAQEAVNEGGLVGPTIENESITTSKFASDPTRLRNTGANFDATAAVGSCVTGLIGSIAGNLFSNAIGSLTSSFLGQEVPVGDSTVRNNTNKVIEKETGKYGVSMDGIAHCIGNMVIEGVLRSTISWVNNGFEGNPAFIDDPEQFFTDIADYELGRALDELSGGVLCSPWDIEIRLGLLSRYRGTNYRRRCTLTDIINNIDNFLEGHFPSDDSAFDAWFELTQNPYNNPYSSYLNAIDEYETRVARRKSNLILELNWGNGFRSERGADGSIETPGTIIQSQVSNALNIPTERLTFADEFDELINALFDSIINNMINGLRN